MTREAADGAARKRTDARRAALAATRERLRLEREYAETLARRLAQTRQDLRLILASQVTDFRRFSASALLESVERAMAANDARLAALARTTLPRAARLGVQQVDEPIARAGVTVVLAPSVDERLIAAAYDNGVALLSPPMQEFQGRAATLARRVALGVESQAAAIEKLGSAIAGRGFDAYAWRAERILRTELSRTLSQATYDRMVAQAARLPFVRKCWRATRDDRTRSTHIDAGAEYAVGRGIRVSERFRVGAVSLRFPVDPDAEPDGAEAAAETINCRCNIFVDFDLEEYRAYTRGQVGAIGQPAARPRPPAPPRPKPARPQSTSAIIDMLRADAPTVRALMAEADRTRAAWEAAMQAIWETLDGRAAKQRAAIALGQQAREARDARDAFIARQRERLLDAARVRRRTPRAKFGVTARQGASIVRPSRADVATARKRLADAVAFIGQLTNRPTWDAVATGGRVPVFVEWGAQAHVTPAIVGRTVLPVELVITAAHRTEIYVHELAHLLEMTDADVLARVSAYLERRTKGGTVVPLSRYGSGYQAHEVTIPDEFLSPYMGKQYVAPSGYRYSTEVLTSALEWLYKNPSELAERDPDLLRFVLELLAPGSDDRAGGSQ